MGLEFFLYGALAGISLATVGSMAKPKVRSHLMKERSFKREASKLDLQGADLGCEVCDRGIDEEEARIIQVSGSREGPLVVCNRTECLLAYTRSSGGPLQKTLDTT